MKLLSSDFDGTLFFINEGGYKENDVKMIHEYQRQGNKIGVCTGRSLFGLRKHMGNLIQFDYIIGCSGAIIYDKDFHIIYKRQIPNAIFKQLHEEYKDQGILFSFKDAVYISKDGCHPVKFDVMYDVSDLMEDMNSLAIRFPSIEEAKKVKDYISNKYEVSVFQNNNSLDIVAKGCSKANGIRFIEEYFHVDHKDSCSIGDNYNDIPMLEYCDTSFAFTYSPEDVQNIASNVVENMAEAIAILLEK